MKIEEAFISGMIRVGKVEDVDIAKKRCRVYYPDVEFVSGWLPVLQTAEWMPSINDMVVSVYKPELNAEGFVVGRIHT